MNDFASELRALKGKLLDWYNDFIVQIPNLVVALLVFILFLLAAKYVRKAVGQLMGRVAHNKSLQSLSETLAYIITLIAGVFFALNIMNLDNTVASLLAGAGIVGLALGFAFQDLTANFISGVGIAIQRPFSIGDVIKTNDYYGKVTSINLRSTLIDNFAGQEVEIPSNMIFQNPITNYSRIGFRRIELQCGVAYNSDLPKVKALALQAVNQLAFVDNNIRKSELNYHSFGASSIDFKLWFWVPRGTWPPHALSEAIIAVKKTFDANDINIPFPIRTLNLMEGDEQIELFTKAVGKNAL
jgi:small conductance mechanosensitive channel